jgi:hypothetical protein
MLEKVTGKNVMMVFHMRDPNGNVADMEPDSPL